MKTLAELAELVGGRLEGDPSLTITGLCGVDEGRPGLLAFAFDPVALAQIEDTEATAVVVPDKFGSRLPHIAVKNPRDAQVRLLRAFDPPEPPPSGIHTRAVVDPSAVIGADPSIGPGVVISAGVVIGDRCRIEANSVLGEGVRMGDDCILRPNVVLYHGVIVHNRVRIDSGAVLGAEGYGYRFEGGRHVRIPQLGTVELCDDVEIGACATIDRAAVGRTVIGEGSKVDNLVMIAHNTRIGRHCLVISQVGIAGSCVLGDGVTLAGQVGVADHVTIGAGSIVGAKSGVAQTLPPGSRVIGIPAMPALVFHRIIGGWRRLPDMLREVRELRRLIKGDEGEAAED